MTKKYDVPKFIKIVKETWFLVLFVGGIIAAWTGLNMRVNAMEKQLALYPSQDYFSLKFENLDEKIDNLSAEIKVVKTLVK